MLSPKGTPPPMHERPYPGYLPVGYRLGRRTAEALVARTRADVGRLVGEAAARLRAEDPRRAVEERVYMAGDLLMGCGDARGPEDRRIALGHAFYWDANGNPVVVGVGMDWETGEVRINR